MLHLTVNKFLLISKRKEKQQNRNSSTSQLLILVEWSMVSCGSYVLLFFV